VAAPSRLWGSLQRGGCYWAPRPTGVEQKIIDPPPSLTRTRREATAAEHKHTPDELHGMVEDMITLLESAVQPELRKGRYPDRKVAHRVSEVVRAVARELDS
jgi:cold shock protein